jgi:hypothetical protein
MGKETRYITKLFRIHTDWILNGIVIDKSHL